VIPDLSVLWVMAFVLLLVVTLDRLLFAPLLRIIGERRRAVDSARDLAERSATRAAEATTEFDRQTKAARADIYGQMDEQRRSALARRTELLQTTRQEAEGLLADGRARLHTETDAARATLARDADALGAAIAARVLGTRS
jgi:F-type H+-transporting ATPase subunit b